MKCIFPAALSKNQRPLKIWFCPKEWALYDFMPLHPRPLLFLIIWLPYAYHMHNKNHSELKLQLAWFIACKFKIMISLSAAWPDVIWRTLFLRLPSRQTSTSISVGALCVCWQRWDKCGYFDTVWYQKTGYLHEKPVPLSPRRALLQEDISNAIKCAKHLLW